MSTIKGGNGSSAGNVLLKAGLLILGGAAAVEGPNNTKTFVPSLRPTESPAPLCPPGYFSAMVDSKLKNGTIIQVQKCIEDNRERNAADSAALLQAIIGVGATFGTMGFAAAAAKTNCFGMRSAVRTAVNSVEGTAMTVVNAAQDIRDNGVVGGAVTNIMQRGGSSQTIY